MDSFFEGFEKKALLSRRMEDIVAGGTAMMPGVAGYGATALHSLAGDRPEGHSHFGEAITRGITSTGAGGAAGALAKRMGAGAGKIKGIKGIGRAIGGVIGSRLTTGKYYQGEQ